MTNWSNVCRGLNAFAGPLASGLDRSCGEVGGGPLAGRDEVDFGLGAEDGGGAFAEQAAVALGDPRPLCRRRFDEQPAVSVAAPGERLEPLMPRGLRHRALELAADLAPGGWVLVVFHGRAGTSSSGRGGSREAIR